MLKTMRVYLLLSLWFPVFLLPDLVHAGTEPLVLKPRIKKYEIGEHTLYFRDFDAALKLDTLRNMKSELWFHSPRKRPNMLMGRDAIWAKFRVRNDSELEDWVLFLDYPLMDTMEVYVFSGEHTPEPDAKALQVLGEKSRLKSFPLKIKKGESKFIYIRVHSRAGRLLYFRVMDKDSFASRQFTDTLLFLIFYSSVFFMCLLNLVLFISTRSFTPFYYIGVLLPFAAYQGGVSGFGPLYLFPDHPEWNLTFLNLLGASASLSVLLFWKHLLLLKVHAPRINMVINGIVVGWSFFIIYTLTPWSDPIMEYLINRVLIASGVVTCLSSGVIALRKGFQPAWYSIIGWVCIILTAAGFFLMLDDVLPVNTYLHYSMFAGYFCEYVFFFIALTARMRFLIKESGDRERILQEKDREVIYRNARLSDADRKNKLRRLAKTGLDVDDVLSRLRDLMEEEKVFCDEDISLQRLASLLDVAPYRLSEIINIRLGKSFFRYVNDFRVSEAGERLLDHPRDSILLIANAVGFNSKSSFNNEFKKATGLTPSAFRKQGRERGANEPAADQ